MTVNKGVIGHVILLGGRAHGHHAWPGGGAHGTLRDACVNEGNVENMSLKEARQEEGAC